MEVQLEAGKSILVIHDDRREAVEQALLLQTWLSESTDLEDKQLLAMEGPSYPPDRGSNTPGKTDRATGQISVRSGSVAAVILLQTSSVL